MCVIVHKPAGVRIEKRTVKEMFEANPHGVGFAYFADDGAVEIVKGLMDFKSAWRAINSFNDVELVIHFRWATHGPTSRRMTHPFVLSSDPEVAQSALWGESVLFHNGVIGRYGTKDMSDTLHFTCDVLAHIPDIDVRIAVLELTSDKFAIMEHDEVILVGRFMPTKGLLVSNLNWQFRGMTGVGRAKWASEYDDSDDPWIQLPDGSYVKESDYVTNPAIGFETDRDYAEQMLLEGEDSPESRIVEDLHASEIARRILSKVEQ